ncbi:uncharacterized protein MKK02DRAFT_41548 [Dioszegia hungarica]|uniref:SP-RING-type domain-containing protein n=1 Tax=Dioszegia hungarica TaxID=4972 RepID=A0AA38H414_9TREE|nr:uncharacterized protein MKK02DRAFT_41548 [Dioszegia hungarica]KAI9631914.1 hypothetical protein MKK02DRAFT_41548 [Dioszegia hungarica]
MARAVNAEASSSRQAARESPEAEGGSDDVRRTKPALGEMEVDDEWNEWTVKTYKSQALKRDVASDGVLTRIADGLRAMETSITDSMSKVIDTAVAVEGNNPDDEMAEELAKSLCRSIEVKAVLEVKYQVIKDILRRMRAGEEIEEIVALYEKEAADKTEEYMKKTPRQKFVKDDQYSQFRSEVWNVNHGSEACPPMSHWLDKTDGDASDSDDEVEVGPTMQNFKCAITHSAIVDAMVNPACKHHYSKINIYQLFEQQDGRNKKAAIKCPSVGCGQKVQFNALQPDKQFQQRADQYFRKQQETADQDVEDFEED